jgi:hypothetical protein
MKSRRPKLWMGVGFILVIALMFTIPAKAGNPPLVPAAPVATETSSPVGTYIIVNSDMDLINVRSAPDPLSSKIGVLLSGQRVPADGKYSVWILIEYPGVQGGVGWIYAPYVTIYGGELPVVEPPPTPTVLYTATIDATLAAQFIVTPEPSRLPTFTLPPAIVIPTYPADVILHGAGNIPIGLIIVGLAALGIFLGFISFVRGR